MEYDLIIIGGGPASFTAAIYAARYKLKTLIISKEPGGYLNKIFEIENFPGYYKISGIDLKNKFLEQIKKYSIEILSEVVTNIKKGFTVITNTKQLKTKTIILALGNERKKLGLKNEEELFGKGISYCATCDSPLFKNKDVAVIGGSYSAVKTALLLSKYAKKIYIIFRKPELKGDLLEIEQVKKDPKIELVKNANVKEIKGTNFLESLVLDTKKEIKVQGLFIEIGAIPLTALTSKLNIKTDERRFIIVNKDKETNVKGVFAAGDITDSDLKQIITACSDGAIAATSAYDYI
ncbi:MAG: FAD-dependent oxidoreductase, partial [Nanoarchaeota archaeon]|nr:FAD-dependent oxidoreductase [Nanoarchaeota archaeon]